MKRNIVFVLGILVLLGIVLIGALIYNQPHRDITGEEASYEVAVDQIYNEFVENQNAAYKKYNEQVVKLAGTIEQVDGNSEPMNFVISENNSMASCEMVAEFREEETLPKVGDPVVVKGLFIGYDDLLGELQFKKCTVIGN